MKALLLHHDKAFPKTHNLEDLNRLIIEVLPLWEVLSDDLLVLTRGATEFRYSGEDATQADAEKAVQVCTILHKKLLSYF